MRTFNFKARNIGQEKYLTYTMGAECELDEDVLDYCEENNLKELVSIIYEEDDDYDYLTYDITDKTSLGDFIKNEVNCEKVLFILRNVANNLISLKEQAIHLSYILMNRSFMYVDDKNFDVKFICLPIESKGSIMTEFKSFIRQLLANMKYDIDEDLGYVGKLLTYINGENFNLRGLIGLTEALMEEAGIAFEEAGTIDADGVEVVSSEEPEIVDVKEKAENVSNFMDELVDGDEALPEIGDDEDEQEDEEAPVVDDDELESILPAGMKVEEAVEDSEEETESAIELQSEEETGNEDIPDEEDRSDEEPELEVMPEEINKQAIKEKELPNVQDILDTVDETAGDNEAGDTDEKAHENEAVEAKTDTQADASKSSQKETDIDLIKNRIKELVGDVPSAKPVGASGQNIKTLEELDQLLDSRPPVVKRNVVKVNRAAIIQNVAAEHVAEEENSQGANATDKVPVIEDIYDDINIEKDEKEKPKSKSILSKSVETPKSTNNLLNAPKAMPYLIRVNTEERIMLSKVTFKIGKATRGVDYTVSGNGAISRQHAVILQKDGVCYIKDNKSTNHTYVNGRMVEEGVEEILTHDSMIKLGDEEFLFKIR